jgi:ferric-dicitrate binding protein FerR (iron transport regulator)
LQEGHFSDGQFKLSQSRKDPLTTLSMNGGELASCKTPVPKGGAGKAALGVARKRSRRLFSSVHGRFRTRGRNSTATVRGTEWTMTDTCSGTLTSVARGTVVVRDFTLRKYKVVKVGEHYFAQAPKKTKTTHRRHRAA